MDFTGILVAGAFFGVVAAIVCSVLAVLLLIVSVRSDDEAQPGIGCALLGLTWAGIAALLLWMARG